MNFKATTSWEHLGKLSKSVVRSRVYAVDGILQTQERTIFKSKRNICRQTETHKPLWAVTKSGTGTWDLGREDAGTWDVGTWGRGDVGLGDAVLGDAGTRGRTEFAICNFRWSRER